jgi:hypothetical protein
MTVRFVMRCSRANTMRWLGQAPEVVCTSEDYGPQWAGLMGTAHVMVDRERMTVRWPSCAGDG